MNVFWIEAIYLLLFWIQFLQRFRSLMKNTNEEKMMKNCSNITRPMQKQLEENLSQQIICHFDSELYWERVVVIIKNYQGFT